MTGDVLRCSSASTMAEAAAALFVAIGNDAIGARGVFTVALAGGSTPRDVYSRLVADEYRARLNWPAVTFFFGDERHVPPDHPDSNFLMADTCLLRPLGIAPDQVWRMKGEYPDPSAAADEYERDLRQVFGSRLPRFDLVLLGMGPDGHTASLFPGTDALKEDVKWVTANRVDALKTQRITLTAPVLINAAEVIFTVKGGDKAEALRAVLDGPYQPERFPAQLVRPRQGRLRWLVDPEAARLLPQSATDRLDATP